MCSRFLLNVCMASCSLTDKGYISQKLFDFLFEDGIQLVTGLRVNMKNKLMPFYDRMMLRKRYIIETMNDMLKNTAQIVHSRHRSVSNFIMNLISALGAYCFFAAAGENGAFPPTRNGCIHSLSMRERG